MSASPLRAILTRLGLSQLAGAALLGIDARTMRRWVADDSRMEAPAKRLVWLLSQRPELATLLESYPDPPADAPAPAEPDHALVS